MTQSPTIPALKPLANSCPSSATPAEPPPLDHAKFAERVFMHALRMPDPALTQPENDLNPHPHMLLQMLLSLRARVDELERKIGSGNG